MEKLEISASIPREKLTEFNQSKLSFLENIQDFEGYHGYSESPGPDFNISINWKDRGNLDAFMKSELYHFFHGAILILGNIHKIIINSDNTNDF